MNNAQLLVSPYLPAAEYIPDGEPHVFGDRLYIFGSHDRYGGRRFCMNDYVSWSAPLSDLSDWRCEGVIFRKCQDPDSPDGAIELWAPDVTLGPDGRYYLYYCLANQYKIGVAVCDSPAGRYEFYGYVQDAFGAAVGTRPGDAKPFDPAVIVDDSGRIHLYSGQGPLNHAWAEGWTQEGRDAHVSSYHMELATDMLTIITEPVPVAPSLLDGVGTAFEGHEFFEGSSIRCFNGKFYFIYSSVQSHELCWSVADTPEGPFSYGGVLISNGDVGTAGEFTETCDTKPADRRVFNYIGNTHGSVELVNGEYYVFYHRHTARRAFSRQACVSKVIMDADGRFLPALMTSCSFSDTLPTGHAYEARIACELYSAGGAVYSSPKVQDETHPAFVQDRDEDFEYETVTPPKSAPMQYIENMRDGATAVYRWFDAADLAKVSRLSVTVRGSAEGYFEFTTRSPELMLGRINVTSGTDWHTCTCTAVSDAFCVSHSPAGTDAGTALYVTYHGQGAADFAAFSLG